MYNHNKAQQSKNRVHISWDILYLSKSCIPPCCTEVTYKKTSCTEVTYKKTSCTEVAYKNIQVVKSSLNKVHGKRDIQSLWHLFRVVLFFHRIITYVGTVTCIYSVTKWIYIRMTSQENHVVSNHRSFDCLTAADLHQRNIKVRILVLCEGNSPVTGEFPAQRSSIAEKSFHLMTSSWDVDEIRVPPAVLSQYWNPSWRCQLCL